MPMAAGVGPMPRRGGCREVRSATKLAASQTARTAASSRRPSRTQEGGRVWEGARKIGCMLRPTCYGGHAERKPYGPMTMTSTLGSLTQISGGGTKDGNEQI